MIHRLAQTSLVALLLAFLHWRSGADASVVGVLLLSVAFAYVLVTCGQLLLFAARLDRSPCPGYVLGLIVLSLAIYVLTLVFPLTAGSAFAIVSIGVVGLDLAFLRRQLKAPVDAGALTAFAVCVAFTAAWCDGPAKAYEIVRSDGVLPVWTDYFFHGSIISQLGDRRAIGHGSILLADLPASFYHYASYSGASAFAGILGEPGLPLATSVWLPLGFLSMAAAAFSMGERLAKGAGGLAALAALTIIPDASNYGLKNGLMSFHWSIFAHPGATYGLGAAFLSAGFLEKWTRKREAAALILSAAMAASAFFFRIHIFLLYFPAWLATVVFSAAPAARRQLATTLTVVVLGVGASGLSAALLQSSALGFPEQWRLGEQGMVRFLYELHVHQEPTAYTGLYADLTAQGASASSLFIGVLLAVTAALGGFLLLLPLAAGLTAHQRRLRPFDVLPAYTAYCWLLLLLFAPLTRPAQATDLIERPIVLLYACCAIWTLCLLLRLWSDQVDDRIPKLKRAMLAGCFLALPIVATQAERLIQPKFAWGHAHVAHRLEPGLVQAAAFLRQHAKAGEIFASGNIGESSFSFDLPMELVSLTGIPTYLSRPRLEMSKNAARTSEVLHRVNALKNVLAQNEYADAMQALRRLSVRWYVVEGARGPRWDPLWRHCAFREGSIAVYAVEA